MNSISIFPLGIPANRKGSGMPAVVPAVFRATVVQEYEDEDSDPEQPEPQTQ